MSGPAVSSDVEGWDEFGPSSDSNELVDDSFEEDDNRNTDEDEEFSESVEDAAEGAANSAHGTSEEALIETYNSGIKEMEKLGLTDIGNLASWTLSSFKQNNGVEALKDDSPLTFWQSDGPQPHHIDIHFSKRVSVERISFFTDYLVDESYTPNKVSVSTGTGYHDLMQLALLESEEARGWVHIPLNNIREDGVIKTFLIRFTILGNLQNGKDTHLRSLKVYSPTGDNIGNQLAGEVGFTSIAMKSESMIR